MISKVQVSKDVEVGEPVLKRETRRTLGGVIENVTYEAPPEPPADLGFFPIFTTPDGTPVSPEDALDAALAGAVLVTPFEIAHSAVHDFMARAHLSIADQVRHQRVLDAFVYVECRKREEAAWKMLGLDVVGIESGSAFFTEKQVAELYGVSVEQVHAMAGQRLPAALPRADGTLVFKAAPVLASLRNAGPAHAPSAPTPRPPADPTPVQPRRGQKASAK
jgi:hypothetical protein